MQPLPLALAHVPGQKQNWPLQMGQPLTEAKYSQQQCKCNKRQMGSEPKPSANEQMH